MDILDVYETGRYGYPPAVVYFRHDSTRLRLLPRRRATSVDTTAPGGGAAVVRRQSVRRQNASRACKRVQQKQASKILK